MKRYLSAVLQALDPRRAYQREAPRAALAAKNFVEYFFKIAGYFLLFCLIVGMTLASCPDDSFLAYLPILTGILFFFYILLTTVGIPIFGVIGQINSKFIRRSLAWITVFLMLIATVHLMRVSPIFDLLIVYVSKLFPAALECTTNPISITAPTR